MSNFTIWFRAQFLGYPYWSVDIVLGVLKGSPRQSWVVLIRKSTAKKIEKNTDGIAYIDYHRVRIQMP